MRCINSKLSVLFVLFFLSCMGDGRKKYKDNFYNYSAGWDYKRLPLMKPYQLRKFDGPEWFLDFVDNRALGANVKKIYVGKGIIIGYEEIVSNSLRDGEWIEANFKNYFVLNTVEKNESLSRDSSLFYSYIKKMKLSEDSLYGIKEINSFYKKFADIGYLPWYSD